MTYHGLIKNGVAVIDTPFPLPDGTRVLVEVESGESAFLQTKTVEELAIDQGVSPVKDLKDLAIDWPVDESVDDFMQVVREAR